MILYIIVSTIIFGCSKELDNNPNEFDIRLGNRDSLTKQCFPEGSLFYIKYDLVSDPVNAKYKMDNTYDLRISTPKFENYNISVSNFKNLDSISFDQLNNIISFRIIDSVGSFDVFQDYKEAKLKIAFYEDSCELFPFDGIKKIDTKNIYLEDNWNSLNDSIFELSFFQYYDAGKVKVGLLDQNENCILVSHDGKKLLVRQEFLAKSRD